MTPMRAMSVYLDSNDYSVLSNPRTQSTETKALRARLLAWAEAGQVEFWYSAAHIIEMAPLDAQYTAVASARADVLVELCSRNALISLDRLVQAELAALRDRNGPPCGVHSKFGDWFPEISDVFAPISRLDRESALANAAAQAGFNREQRRKFRKLSLRGGNPRQNISDALSPDAIIAEYPMRPEDATVLRDYVAGQATAEQAGKAFLASLRDPNWMMRWFAQHSDAMTPIVEWMRGPARKLRSELTESTSKLTALLQDAKEQRERLRMHGIDDAALGAMPLPNAKTLGGQTVIKMVRGLMGKVLQSETTDFEAHDLDQHAPGLATALHTYFEVVSRSIGLTARTLKDSDFVDIVHSVYAPYVDIFRTDSFMAPVVRKAVRGESIIVSRLPELPGVIEGQLKRRALR